MKTWLAIAFGVLMGLLAAGVVLLASSQPRGEPIRLLPPPTSSPLVVYVSGAVADPAVYTLPLGSRLEDAIRAAGGLLPDANAENLNLAAPLSDGQMVKIPLNREIDATPPLDYPTSQPYPTFSSHLVNINTASQEELESLPGIGPVLARRIIAFRQAYGPFVIVEDIRKIYGLSQDTYELIKDLIIVSEMP